MKKKKDRKDTNTPRIRTSTEKHLVLSIFLENRKGLCWDPKITGSGHPTAKLFVARRLGGDFLAGFGQDHNEDDKWNTLRAKRGLPHCMSAVDVTEFMSWYKVSTSRVVIRRTPGYPFSGRSR